MCLGAGGAPPRLPHALDRAPQLWRGVHEVQAIQYFIEGCRDGTHLKHKLLCSEPATLADLMAKADKYAMADSAMRMKVATPAKPAPPPAAPRTATDDRQQQNNKRKADQPESRYRSRQVATIEEEQPAGQASSQRQRTGKATWQPKLTFEQMLDLPCKHHSGAKLSTHRLR